MAGPGSVAIRRATHDDEKAILEVLAASLGWAPDRLHRRFLAWKHRESPFGPSFSWVATIGGRVAGFRAFMPWEFETPAGTVRAVRAVDTATHPAFQGRGVFRRLTMHALEALRADGVAFVFNTPNQRSRPGYLKMGWQIVGRVPISVRPRRLASLPRLARARTPAERWSLPCAAGTAARIALEDAAMLSRWVPSGQDPSSIRTARSVEYLRWRYGFPPLRYRAVLAPAAGGMALFRLRRRGPAVEAAVTEVLVHGDDCATGRRLLREVLRRSGADYAVCTAVDAVGFVPLPGQGPVLTWRAVCAEERPPLGAWRFSLGDIELL